MKYARLGQSGLVVSKLALGSMTFGTGRGPFASTFKVSQAAANDIVARAIERGVNFFNSADVYAGGESERASPTSAVDDLDTLIESCESALRREAWADALQAAERALSRDPASHPAATCRAAARARHGCPSSRE